MRSYVFATLFIFAAGVTADLSGPKATIDSGVVVGRIQSVTNAAVDVEQFLGIPFAASPERFKPPHLPMNWTEPYDATKYRASCIQAFGGAPDVKNLSIQMFNTPPPPAGESEDCLNLNIYTPQGGEDKKAVLFWIFGGSFAFGSGSLPLYDGSFFAAKHDVIVVTINYRTNIFGFVGSKEMPKNERNLGLLDQRLALDWVRRNIAAFKGDPQRVTIFGESAGAGSVDALLTTPPDPLPFRAAILQSGQQSMGQSMAAQVEESWAKIVKETDCPEEGALDCVRGKPAARLKEIVERLGSTLTFSPIEDGETFSGTARQDRRKSTNETSSIARVPILIGTNANEASSQVMGMGMNDTAQFLTWALKVINPWMRISEDVEKERIKTILDAYPLDKESGMGTELERIERIVTDFEMHCRIKIFAEENRGGGIPTYRYRFDAGFPNSTPFPGAGAFHSAEIALIFGTYKRKNSTIFQTEVSNVMQKAWADFAKDPTKGPGWSQIPEVGVFGGGVRPGEAVTGRPLFAPAKKSLDQICELWKHLY